MLITYKQWVLELWYLSWVFLVTRPFIILTLTLTLYFDLHFEKVSAVDKFPTVRTGALILCRSSHSDKTFLWVPTVLILWPWPWSLAFFQNLNLVYNLTVNTRTLLFFMNISYDKVFLFILNVLTLTFDLFQTNWHWS